MRRSMLFVMVVVAACGGGGGDDGEAPDAMVPFDSMVNADADLSPETLAETGLCVDSACTQIADGIYQFAPEYILWSDGATKRRWIYLPPGTQIDTSDMDYWEFPVGTKLWKEFTRGDTRVETRLIMRTGPEPTDFYYAAYEWNADQDEATLVDPITGSPNANGTEHDVPTRTDCRGCHDRQQGRVLGFSAIQLDHQPTEDALVNLQDAIDLGWLSDPPTSSGGAGAEYFPLPGTAVDQTALGYLHANCGNCHNPTSQVLNTVPVVWRLEVGKLTDVQDTPTWTTAWDVGNMLPIGAATAIIEPNNPGASAAYLRMNTLDTTVMMPKIGHELIDTDGVAALEAWITSPQ